MLIHILKNQCIYFLIFFLSEHAYIFKTLIKDLYIIFVHNIEMSAFIQFYWIEVWQHRFIFYWAIHF